MEIKTRDFGIIDVNEEDFITFKEPILGFDDTVYTIISMDDIGTDFVFLQSTQNEKTCFILVNPGIFSCEYSPVILKSYRESLQIADDSDMIIWNIGTIYDDLTQSTVNLKSPIIINVNKNIASQIVLDNDYPLKYHIYAEVEGVKC